MRLLFLSPHPDDAEISCGGTIARMVHEGHEVDIAVMVGEGDLPMVHSGQVVPFSQRRDEQERAAKVLGVRRLHWLEIGPASKLDESPLSKGVIALDKLLAIGFDEFYVPLPSHNQDHTYTWNVAIAAMRPTKNDRMAAYAYEQATQFHGTTFDGGIMSRHYVTYGKMEQDIKERAIACHQCQMTLRENSLAGIGGARKLAELRGMEVGARFAEMYVPLRRVI